jgi:beta-lactam-binding protein with PASTA domain
VILIVVALLLLAVIAYTFLIRDNPRQVAVDAEREQVADQALFKEPVDFESDLRPPPDEAP